MKINLFGKLVVSYIAVIFMAMLVAGGLQYFLLKDYLLDNKEEELTIRSREMAAVIRPVLLEGKGVQGVINSIHRADRFLGVEAWVINSEGKVMAVSPEHLYDKSSIIESADLYPLAAGETSVQRIRSPYYSEPVIQVAAPVLEQGRFIGAVVLYTPVTGINETFYRVERIYTVTALLGIVMSVVLGLILSRYIAKPLREVSGVAHEIAKGNFDRRVKINSPDELGQLGNAINYMTDRLAEYEKMRRDFVANVSHELRSPITSIRGFIDALAEGRDKDQEERNKYLDILQKETYRLSKLVKDLLEISKFDAQGIQMSMEQFPVVSIINRAAASLKPQLESKFLQVELRVSEELICYGDEDRIEQVVHNLLENAIRHSFPGGIITISAARLDEEILVQVADNGPGIARDEIPRIWERFYRVDKDRARSKGGTGLGLAIVQEIIRKHGGRVMVESEPGQGAVFGFTLPVSRN